MWKTIYHYNDFYLHDFSNAHGLNTMNKAVGIQELERGDPESSVSCEGKDTASIGEKSYSKTRQKLLEEEARSG